MFWKQFKSSQCNYKLKKNTSTKTTHNSIYFIIFIYLFIAVFNVFPVFSYPHPKFCKHVAHIKFIMSMFFKTLQKMLVSSF